MSANREVIVITEAEIVQSIQRYEESMHDLAVMLNEPSWSRVGIAFGHWANSRDDPWQVLYIEAKHYINQHRKAPWDE